MKGNRFVATVKAITSAAIIGCGQGQGLPFPRPEIVPFGTDRFEVVMIR